VSNYFGQVAERDLRMHADDFVPAARAAGADVTYEVHAGVHAWPYWRGFLSDAITWGFFRPVTDSPRAWTYKTVMRVSAAWGYSFVFAAPPGEVETFSRAGGRLRGAGGGRVTVRGPGGCRFTVKLPFSHAVCRAGGPKHSH
jgi:hypothetical protein